MERPSVVNSNIRCIEVHSEDGEVHRYYDNYILVAVAEEGIVGFRYMDESPITRLEILVRALTIVSDGFNLVGEMGNMPLLADLVRRFCEESCNSCDQPDCPLRR